MGWIDFSSGQCVPCVRNRWKELNCKQMWDATRQHEMKHCSEVQSKHGTVNCKKFAFEPDKLQSAGHDYRKVIDAQVGDTAEAGAALNVSPDGSFSLRVWVGEASGKSLTTESGSYGGYCEPIPDDSYPPGVPIEISSAEKGPWVVTGQIEPRQRKISEKKKFGSATVTVELEEF